MSTLRFDETTADWVVLAPTRRLRPHTNQLRPQACEAQPEKACPFCPGNESMTPPDIYTEHDDKGWKVRVFPNMFPALTIEDNPARRLDSAGFQTMGGCGAHEVIIESRDHSMELALQPVEQIELVLRTLQRRYVDLMQDARFQTVVIFKNHGRDAGTSLEHPHWQLLATAIVPRWLRVKHFEAAEYYDRTGQCLYCVLLGRELAADARIVDQNEHFVAFLPFAGHTPFEMWIAPRMHQSSFRMASADQLRSLSQLLKAVLLKLYAGLDNPAFNLTIDDVPRGDEDKEYFLWHIRVIPRLTTPAGFELGSGMSINTVAPEEATKFLRDTVVPG